jgi:hypothetical protein
MLMEDHSEYPCRCKSSSSVLIASSPSAKRSSEIAWMCRQHKLCGLDMVEPHILELGFCGIARSSGSTPGELVTAVLVVHAGKEGRSPRKSCDEEHFARAPEGLRRRRRPNGFLGSACLRSCTPLQERQGKFSKPSCRSAKHGGCVTAR